MNNCSDTTRLFFDFYSMNELYLRCGGFRSEGYPGYSTFISEKIYQKIEAKYNEVVDTMYKRVHDALIKSLQSEIRHFPNQCRYYYNGNESTFYADLEKKHGLTKKMISNAKKDVFAYADNVYMVFNCPQWHSSYGGKKWAKAAKMLMDSNRVRTTQAKVAWVDKVLDLHHNTGHLLNKTAFADLSCVNIEVPGKKNRKRHLTALDFRAKERSIMSFIPYNTTAVKNLVVPRANLLKTN